VIGPLLLTLHWNVDVFGLVANWLGSDVIGPLLLTLHWNEDVFGLVVYWLGIDVLGTWFCGTICHIFD